jgi:hypothetical protein
MFQKRLTQTDFRRQETDKSENTQISPQKAADAKSKGAFQT